MERLMTGLLAGLSLAAQAGGPAKMAYPVGYRDWRHVKSLELKPGHGLADGKRKVLEVMVRNSQQYAATGGWGFEAFVGGDLQNPSWAAMPPRRVSSVTPPRRPMTTCFPA